MAVFRVGDVPQFDHLFPNFAPCPSFEKRLSLRDGRAVRTRPTYHGARPRWPDLYDTLNNAVDWERVSRLLTFTFERDIGGYESLTLLCQVLKTWFGDYVTHPDRVFFASVVAFADPPEFVGPGKAVGGWPVLDRAHPAGPHWQPFLEPAPGWTPGELKGKTVYEWRAEEFCRNAADILWNDHVATRLAVVHYPASPEHMPEAVLRRLVPQVWDAMRRIGVAARCEVERPARPGSSVSGVDLLNAVTDGIDEWGRRMRDRDPIAHEHRRACCDHPFHPYRVNEDLPAEQRRARVERELNDIAACLGELWKHPPERAVGDGNRLEFAPEQAIATVRDQYREVNAWLMVMGESGPQAPAAVPDRGAFEASLTVLAEACLSRITPPVQEKATDGRVKQPPMPDHPLLALAKMLELGGNQLTFIKSVVEDFANHGECRKTIADYTTIFGWSNPTDNWNSLRKELDKKFKGHGWVFRTHDGVPVAKEEPTAKLTPGPTGQKKVKR